MRNIILVSILMGAPVAMAHGAPPPEVQACAQHVGVEGVPRREMSSEQHDKMKACLEQKGFHPGFGHHKDFAKFKACVESKGGVMPDRPPKGQRPVLDDKTRAIFDQCHNEMHAQEPQQ